MLLYTIQALGPLLVPGPARTRALLDMLAVLGPFEAGVVFTAIQNLHAACYGRRAEIIGTTGGGGTTHKCQDAQKVKEA